MVQSDRWLHLSTALIAPTSRSAPRAIFRPEIDFGDGPTNVLVEQLTAVAPERLGAFAGRISSDDQRRLDAALERILALR